MAIPQGQLETWSHSGATGLSSRAYAGIQEALGPLGLEVSLQGSYANSTHVFADSDIDVVVLSTATFYYDLSGLPQPQQNLHEALVNRATYGWPDLKRDVLARLRAHYGTNAVTEGNKAIKVRTGVGRMTADVVPAMEFRSYTQFGGFGPGQLLAHWGICFWDRNGSRIVNYPRYHIDNGEAKNGRTTGAYKPTIRIFKNLRSHLVDNRLLADGIAPSYFIECALHNAPDHLFRSRFDQSIPALIDHLLHVPFRSLICQNGVVPLIGSGNTQWHENDFTTFITAAASFWNNG